MVNLQEILHYTNSLTVLYVEDDLSLLESTKELLSNFFPVVTTAVDGENGLNKYKEFYQTSGKYYDLVITDVNMPNLNGIDMSKEILKINSSQGIIITTAHNEVEYLRSAVAIGIDGFISKPINTQNLLASVFKASKAVSDHKFVQEHSSNN